jgi:hypothetical protein
VLIIKHQNLAKRPGSIFLTAAIGKEEFEGALDASVAAVEEARVLEPPTAVAGDCRGRGGGARAGAAGGRGGGG